MSRPLIFCKNTKNFKQEEQLSMKMPNFSKISLFLVKFWGCPFRRVKTQRKAVSLCEAIQNEG